MGPRAIAITTARAFKNGFRHAAHSGGCALGQHWAGGGGEEEPERGQRKLGITVETCGTPTSKVSARLSWGVGGMWNRFLSLP